MKIAIDAQGLTSGHAVRGIGVYLRELLNANFVLGYHNVKILENGYQGLTEKFDVVHFTSFNPFRISVPDTKPVGTKFVLTIYDLIPLIYPKHYPSGIKGWLNWEKNKNLIKKNVDGILTISETSKKDICRFMKIDPKKVFVTYLAARPIFKKLDIEDRKSEMIKRYHVPDFFVLYVGDINYNKNIPNLVEACKIARTPLVIAGKQAAEIEYMNLNHPELKHLRKIDWTTVVRPGYVPDEDLVTLYNMANCFIQPSLYEGFGLPSLEAYACETPIVATKTQALTEILGDEFEYVDPNDPKSIAKGILKPNINKRLPRLYSWEVTAKETMQVYKTI